MKTLRKIFVLMFGLTLLFLVAACEDEGPMEKAGEQADEAIENTQETMEEAGENVQEGVEEAGDKMEEAGDKMTN